MQISPRVLKHFIVALCAFNLGLASAWLMAPVGEELPIPGREASQQQYLPPVPAQQCRPEYPDSYEASSRFDRLVGIEKKIIDLDEKLKQLAAKDAATDAEIFINLEKISDLTNELDRLVKERNGLVDRLFDDGRANLLYREVCF
ncbi:MAG TPA: hypothetical protein VMZ26_10465 [Pyrinomonadaceae bacterium]|nr:hypothetical protein [Pyrinomonadaceae bacterium]